MKNLRKWKINKKFEPKNINLSKRKKCQCNVDLKKFVNFYNEKTTADKLLRILGCKNM